MTDALLAPDREFCERVLPGVSRTFALSISLLAGELQQSVCASYLLCRILDSVEDDATLALKDRLELYGAFDQLIADDARCPLSFERACARLHVGDNAAERELCERTSAPLRLFRGLSDERRAAIRPHILEMSAGMRQYSVRSTTTHTLRIEDVADLERYCYFVAGTVGKLLTGLFELEVPNLSADARALIRREATRFGIGLQLVNILKDVAEDMERQVCFLPLNLAAQNGIRLEQILEPRHRAAGTQVLRVVCENAKRHLRAAEEYCLAWPAADGNEIRLFCAVPLSLAFATLREVEGGKDTLQKGNAPKVSRETVFRAVADAKHAVNDDASLRGMLAYYGGVAQDVAGLDEAVLITGQKKRGTPLSTS